jgi:hypothetical protein
MPLSLLSKLVNQFNFPSNSANAGTYAFFLPPTASASASAYVSVSVSVSALSRALTARQRIFGDALRTLDQAARAFSALQVNVRDRAHARARARARAESERERVY